MYILTYMYNVSRDFSLPPAIEMHGQPFFSVLSDRYNNYYNYVTIVTILTNHYSTND